MPVLRTVRLSGCAPCPGYRSRPGGFEPSRFQPYWACALRLLNRCRSGKGELAGFLDLITAFSPSRFARVVRAGFLRPSMRLDRCAAQWARPGPGNRSRFTEPSDVTGSYSFFVFLYPGCVRLSAFWFVSRPVRTGPHRLTRCCGRRSR